MNEAVHIVIIVEMRIELASFIIAFRRGQYFYLKHAYLFPIRV